MYAFLCARNQRGRRSVRLRLPSAPPSPGGTPALKIDAMSPHTRAHNLVRGVTDPADLASTQRRTMLKSMSRFGGHVTSHPTPYTLHPTPYTLHPTPYTLHPTPYTAARLLLQVTNLTSPYRDSTSDRNRLNFRPKACGVSSHRTWDSEPAFERPLHRPSAFGQIRPGM